MDICMVVRLWGLPRDGISVYCSHVGGIRSRSYIVSRLSRLFWIDPLNRIPTLPYKNTPFWPSSCSSARNLDSTNNLNCSSTWFVGFWNNTVWGLEFFTQGKVQGGVWGWGCVSRDRENSHVIRSLQVHNSVVLNPSCNIVEPSPHNL